LSTNVKSAVFMSIGMVLLTFGCATVPPKTVTPPKQSQEPVATPKPAPEAQPVTPAPEKTEPVKEPEPSEPVTPSPPVPEPRPTVPGAVQPDRAAPRTVASLRLTEQARLLIESKKPDDAIRLLEKAINIDTNNGQNYYFLAEAWIMKGNKTQANEFNRLAIRYLNNDGSWNSKVQQQKERINKMKSVK
jgi:tetratricopeptide (TPR) repeat protein